MTIRLHVRSRVQSKNIDTLITFFCKDSEGDNFFISCDNEMTWHEPLYALLSTYEYLSLEVDETRISDDRIDAKGHTYRRIPPGAVDAIRSKEITCDQFYTDGWGGI